MIEVYKIASSFPKSELYALASQLKRSAYSVPANIVEGNSRQSTKEYIRFLFTSRGSLEELRYFLFLSKDLKYIESERYDLLENSCMEISKMLNGLIKTLRNKL